MITSNFFIDNLTINKFYKNFRKDIFLLLLFLPTMLYFLIFCYYPMYGALIAFMHYSPGKGIFGSEWVGLKWFFQFFNSIYFFRLLRNTFILSLYSIIFGFPVPIIFALILNEIRFKFFKRIVQTLSYLPYFISTVVVVGIIVSFLSPTTGIVNLFLQDIGLNTIDFLNDPKYFRTIFVITGIWKSFGMSSIIYLAQLSSVDIQIYESARMDGANRWQQLVHITIPSLMPTITILLILSIGGILNVDFERVLLMYSPSTYETADVISTYVYRRGVLGNDYSFGTAVGLFNSVINFMFLFAANKVTKKTGNVSLW